VRRATTTPTALAEQLVSLGLRPSAAHLNDIVARATTHRWSPTQLLEHVVQAELDERARRGLERRLSRARLGRFKSMADFDWAWPKKIARDAVESALRLDFLTQARSVVLVAPQGLGKTMIAQNIGHHAVLAGHAVRFVTASQLLLDLAAQDSARALDRRLRHYGSRTTVLIVDEIGYLSYDSRNADLRVQVVSRRHERRRLVLTTNLAFRDWQTIFPNATSAVALIDRLIHHADVIAIEGESYRLREAEQALTKKATPRAQPPKG
jgi:DNA replication protein DnaC